jgi:hypothetical protein
MPPTLFALVIFQIESCVFTCAGLGSQFLWSKCAATLVLSFVLWWGTGRRGLIFNWAFSELTYAENSIF